MKGQLTVEYFVSLVFFMGFVIYIYMNFAANVPKFITEIQREDIRSKAYQISALLLDDTGDPPDWYSDIDPNMGRIGLSDENYGRPNLLSLAKITALDGICNSTDPFGYEFVQNKLSIDEPFSIFVFEIEPNGDRTPLLSCEPTIRVERTIRASVKRIVAYNTGAELGLAELIVEV